MVKQRKLAKLLAKVGDTVTCDLCPSFRIDVSDQRLDVRLFITMKDGRQWYTSDEETKERLRRRFDQLASEVTDTAESLELYKLGVARALIREAQAGNLFRDEAGVDGGEGSNGAEGVR